MKNKQLVQVDEAAQGAALDGMYDDHNTQEKLMWLKDAGFGLFIHWTVDVQLGGVISHSLVGASADYARRYFEELPATFLPEAWNPARLARLTKISGARYAVFTTKHHNGFCMWDTRSTPFSIINTPYGRDIVREYVDAFRQQGIAVGFYFSPEDFWFLHTHDQTITRNPTEPFRTNIIEKYRAHLTLQMQELMSNYGPIDLIFFDGGELMKDEHGESLQELCKQLAWSYQPGILVTRGAIRTPEQQLPGVGTPETWEACLTVSTAWGYQPTNDLYKTGAHLIALLMRTRAMGGALLLNVGPDSDGAVSGQQEGLLREMGLWNFINHEAVYGVRPWSIVEEGNILLLSDKAGQTVYAVLSDQNGWNRGERRTFALQSVCATERSTASVLGASGELTEYRPDLDAASYLTQSEEGLTVSVMKSQRIYCGMQWPNPMVVKITHVRKAFDPMVVHTLPEETDVDSTPVLVARVVSLGSFREANVYFQWRRYPGFAMASYEEGWQATSQVEVAGQGDVRIPLRGLTPSTTWQFRAVIENTRNRMQGEMRLFVTEKGTD